MGVTTTEWALCREDTPILLTSRISSLEKEVGFVDLIFDFITLTLIIYALTSWDGGTQLALSVLPTTGLFRELFL